MNKFAVLDWLTMETARILRNLDPRRRPMTVRVSDGVSEYTVRTEQQKAGTFVQPLTTDDARDLVTLGLNYSFEAVSDGLRKHLSNYWTEDDLDAFRIASFGSNDTVKADIQRVWEMPMLAISTETVDTDRVSS